MCGIANDFRHAESVKASYFWTLEKLAQEKHVKTPKSGIFKAKNNA